MDNIDKCNLAVENLRNIQELIRFIDQKTNFLFIIFGFLITIFFEFSQNFVFCNPNIFNGVKCFLSWGILIFGGCFIFSIIYQFYIILFKVIFSRKANICKRKHESLFYSEHIASKNRFVFINDFKLASDKKILSSILSQTYEVAKIFNIKNENYCKATKILVLNICFLLIYTLLSRIFLSNIFVY